MSTNQLARVLCADDGYRLLLKFVNKNKKRIFLQMRNILLDTHTRADRSKSVTHMNMKINTTFLKLSPVPSESQIVEFPQCFLFYHLYVILGK